MHGDGRATEASTAATATAATVATTVATAAATATTTTAATTAATAIKALLNYVVVLPQGVVAPKICECECVLQVIPLPRPATVGEGVRRPTATGGEAPSAGGQGKQGVVLGAGGKGFKKTYFLLKMGGWGLIAFCVVMVLFFLKKTFWYNSIYFLC